ncbi:sensor histidine kinase [Paenibacillus bovis]|uniref:histidine kinase n=1 Tax=Paenibacillus bovis TaxID=1616788 RepID=A0A172ZI22_9BACL|nr:HAMP domain-containing sensor histidine kinase [Paenibacillus bovis]ANF97285.1 two-component sensor histidine kinase [Paenibacillus bovis]
MTKHSHSAPLPDSLTDRQDNQLRNRHPSVSPGRRANLRQGLSLRWKFPLFLGALLVFTIVILSTLVLSGIRANQQKQTEYQLQYQSQNMEMRIHQEYLTGKRLTPEEFMKLRGSELAVDLGLSSNMRVILYDARGQLVGDSLPLARRTDVTSALHYALQDKTAYITQGSSILYLAPMHGPDGLLGAVQLHLSILEQQTFYRSTLLLCIWTGAVVLVLSFVIGWIYIRRQTSDIQTLMVESRSIASGHYPDEQHYLLRRRDELGQLGDGIVHMGGMIRRSIEELQSEKRQLEQAVSRLSELEQLQKAFIGNISHELKTPATSIQAYADLLEMYGDDPQLVHEASTSISSEIRRLISLIEDSIRLSLLEKYDFEMNIEQLQLDTVLQEAIERTRGKAAAAGITLTAEPVNAEVQADHGHLMHILLNLLDNAVKYNLPEQGWIHIAPVDDTAFDTSAASTHTHYVLAISNSGPLIPPEKWETVFEPYTTLSSDRSRTGSGTGLGLPLARRLAQRMGGRLYIASSGPEGNRIILELTRI